MRPHMIFGFRAAALTTALVAGRGMAGAAQAQDYGFDWVTIGNAGNRGATVDEVPLTPLRAGIGAVGYEYRLTRSEVTTGQYLEFVQAYEPYWDGAAFDSSFIGSLISFTEPFPEPGMSAGYFVQPQYQDVAANMSWEFAARYVNWLHNDKRTDREAFETGVYDTSTFVQVDGVNQHQLAHNPDARFWIPTADELAKGLYHDPDRYGAGQEGFWLYPDQGNEPLELGVETNAGGIPPFVDDYRPVGSFPDVASAYGLLDGSGGVSEWTESLSLSGSRSRRLQFGSSVTTLSFAVELEDRLDYGGAGLLGGASGGLRIATVVPGPATVWALPPTLLSVIRRRRR